MADPQTTDQNDDDAVLARAAEIQAARAAQAREQDEAALAARREQFAPLSTLLASDAFARAREQAATARDALMTPQTQVAYGMLNALVSLMDNLAMQVPADVRQPAAG